MSWLCGIRAEYVSAGAARVYSMAILKFEFIFVLGVFPVFLPAYALRRVARCNTR